MKSVVAGSRAASARVRCSGSTLETNGDAGRRSRVVGARARRRRGADRGPTRRCRCSPPCAAVVPVAPLRRPSRTAPASAGHALARRAHLARLRRRRPTRYGSSTPRRAAPDAAPARCSDRLIFSPAKSAAIQCGEVRAGCARGAARPAQRASMRSFETSTRQSFQSKRQGLRAIGVAREQLVSVVDESRRAQSVEDIGYGSEIGRHVTGSASCGSAGAGERSEQRMAYASTRGATRRAVRARRRARGSNSAPIRGARPTTHVATEPANRADAHPVPTTTATSRRASSASPTALAPHAEITVVAPERDRSGASNSLTLDRPLSVRRAPNGFLFVNGTPTDCVHLAVTGLLDELPDMVVSGINLRRQHGRRHDLFGHGRGGDRGLPARHPVDRGLAASSKTGDAFRNRRARRARPGRAASAPAVRAPWLLNVNVPDVPHARRRRASQSRASGERHKAEAVIADAEPARRDRLLGRRGGRRGRRGRGHRLPRRRPAATSR